MVIAKEPFLANSTSTVRACGIRPRTRSSPSHLPTTSSLGRGVVSFAAAGVVGPGGGVLSVGPGGVAGQGGGGTEGAKGRAAGSLGAAATGLLLTVPPAARPSTTPSKSARPVTPTIHSPAVALRRHPGLGSDFGDGWAA